MREFTIDHPHNEASALLAIHSHQLLDAYGWDVGFWIASDEAPVHKAVAALGRRRKRRHDKDGGWEVRKVRFRRSGDKATDDCEAMARAGAWIYVFGSQYGPKDGPLDADRHFVARFNESLVEARGKGLRADLEVARRPFVLHRIVNRALRKAKIDVIGRGKHVRRAFIRGTRKKSTVGRKRVRNRDHPINLEGATFLPNGRLLLGLRYPVTADGHPILVEVDGVDRIFERDDPKAAFATRVWTLRNVGRKGRPKGIREVDQRGLVVHVITGSLERRPEDAKVLHDHPEGDKARSEHWTFTVPDDDDEVRLKAKRVRRFPKTGNVEGFALFEDGCVWYAHDDERIRLSRADAGGR